MQSQQAQAAAAGSGLSRAGTGKTNIIDRPGASLPNAGGGGDDDDEEEEEDDDELDMR